MCGGGEKVANNAWTFWGKAMENKEYPGLLCFLILFSIEGPHYLNTFDVSYPCFDEVFVYAPNTSLPLLRLAKLLFILSLIWFIFSFIFSTFLLQLFKHISFKRRCIQKAKYLFTIYKIFLTRT